MYIFKRHYYFILGYLPGNAFWVNSHGLAVTGNIVMPAKVYWKERLGKEDMWNPLFSNTCIIAYIFFASCMM